MNAKPFVDDIEHAVYKSKNPDALLSAVKNAEVHIKAMKKIARKPPKHPGSCALVDSSGEYDPHMYTLVNLMVDARKMAARIKKQRR